MGTGKIIKIAITCGIAGILWGMAVSASARSVHKEREYQSKWCAVQGGVMEVRQADRSRVDCLTPEYAVEFDFGPKWAESIGQSLLYAAQTGRTAGIVLILEKESDLRYWNRLLRVIRKHHLNIRTWIMRPADL